MKIKEFKIDESTKGWFEVTWSDEEIEIMNARINYIRDVSNMAEIAGTKVEDIKWEL